MVMIMVFLFYFSLRNHPHSLGQGQHYGLDCLPLGWVHFAAWASPVKLGLISPLYGIKAQDPFYAPCTSQGYTHTCVS